MLFLLQYISLLGHSSFILCAVNCFAQTVTGCHRISRMRPWRLPSIGNWGPERSDLPTITLQPKGQSRTTKGPDFQSLKHFPSPKIDSDSPLPSPTPCRPPFVSVTKGVPNTFCASPALAQRYANQQDSQSREEGDDECLTLATVKSDDGTWYQRTREGYAVLS